MDTDPDRLAVYLCLWSLALGEVINFSCILPAVRPAKKWGQTWS